MNHSFHMSMLLNDCFGACAWREQLGTGDRMHRVPKKLEDELRSHGIRVESMSSNAAGTTFNMLCDEGRDCVACLLPNSKVNAKDETWTIDKK